VDGLEIVDMSCCDKKGFGTEAEAIKFAKRTARNNRRGRRQRAYLCDDCGQWHLTTQKDVKNKMNRQKWKRKNKGTW